MPFWESEQQFCHESGFYFVISGYKKKLAPFSQFSSFQVVVLDLTLSS
jgi:hypothetical protein